MSEIFDNRNYSATTAQKMKFSIKDFCSKCEQIRSSMRVWSHLLKKSLMENFIFYAVNRSQVWEVILLFDILTSSIKVMVLL